MVYFFVMDSQVVVDCPSYLLWTKDRIGFSQSSKRGLVKKKLQVLILGSRELGNYSGSVNGRDKSQVAEGDAGTQQP